MPRELNERFVCKGLRTGSPADALAPGEFIMLQNVRGNTLTEMQTRAGSVLKFSTENSPVQNTSSYTDPTGTTPRYLSVVNGKVYLDDGTVVDTGYTSPI